MKLNHLHEYGLTPGASLTPRRDQQLQHKRQTVMSGPTNDPVSSELQQLRDMAVEGNAHDDRDLLSLAHEIAVSDLPMKERFEALWHMDRAMGTDPPLDLRNQEECTEALRDYVEAVGGM